MNRLFAKASICKIAAAAVFTSAALIITGCGIGTAAGPAASSPVTGASIHGLAHGGQQGISGATVDLRQVGTTGYGAGSASLLSIPVLTGNGGSNSATIASWTLTGAGTSVSPYIATFTGTNDFSAGEAVTLSGFTNGTQFNGQTVTVLAAGLTATTFEAYFNSANASGIETSAVAGDAGPGYFNITEGYTCPSASTLVYLTVSGGNSGGGTNSAIKLLVPLGKCGNLTSSTFVYANEVTTAAAAYALGNFYTTSGGIGANGASGTQSYTGLTNAFATVNNLVSTSAGTAVTSQTLSGTGTASAGSIIVVPEASQLNTLANIIAACVSQSDNSNFPSTNCSTLFTNAPLPTTPTDTMQAAVNIVQNPTLNVSSLYGLTGGFSPFSEGSQPIDFTLGIQYQDGGGASPTMFLKPQNLAIDSYGNVWVLSANGTAGALDELSPSGTPIANVSTLGIDGPFALSSGCATLAGSTGAGSAYTDVALNYLYTGCTATTGFGASSGNPAISVRNMAIDASNNVWFTESSSTGLFNGNVEAVSGSSGIGVAGGTALGGFSTGKSAYGIAIDGNSDVFVTEQSSSYKAQYFELPAGNFLTPILFPFASATPGTVGVTNYLEGEYAAVDTSGNVWEDAGTATAGTVTTSALELTGITTTSGGADLGCPSLTSGDLCTTGTSTSINTETTLPMAVTGPYGLAAGNGTMWIADAGTAASASFTVTEYATSSSASTTNSSAGNTYPATNANEYINFPHFIAVDGGGNVWVGDETSTSPAVNGGISELNSSGVPLSPASATPTTTPPGFAHSALNNAGGVGIDPSGNVWVAQNASGGSATLIEELVGAGVPTVTPIALALHNSKVGQKP